MTILLPVLTYFPSEKNFIWFLGISAIVRAMPKNRPLLFMLSLFAIHSSANALIGGRKVTERDSHGPSRSVVMIDLKKDEKHLASCTATLISRNALLTAAHCFDKYMIPGANRFDVVFDVFENGQAKRVTLRGSHARKHPQYTGSGPVQQLLQYDIAVAFFHGQIPEGMAPVPFDKDTSADYGGRTVQVFGYGRSVDYRKATNKDPAYSTGTLRVAPIQYQPLSSVRHILFTSHDEKTLAYLCQGDSGGPQFLVTSKGFKLVAVTSAGGAAPAGAKGGMSCINPGSVALVAPAASWIDKQIKGL